MAAVEKKVVSVKKKDSKNIEKGKVFVHASQNNTIVTITDMDGNVIAWSSGGVVGNKNSRKQTGYAGTKAAEDAAKKAQQHGLRTVEVYVSGGGQGRETAVRAIGQAGITVTKISDVTPIPHNGCRPPKHRRL